jgi:recombination protein RecA
MSIQDIIKDLEGACVLSEDESVSEFVDSGSLALNKIISGRFDGGYPIGGITEIFGESSTAKTVFLTHAFVGAQAKGYHTVMVDNEHAYNKEFASQLGVDPFKLIYSEPETIETCFAFIEKVILAIRSHDTETPIVIGFDSIGTTPCNKELSDELKDSDGIIIGAQRAKITGQCLRRVNTFIKKYNVALLIINQFRSKIGVMFGDPRTKAGGGKSLEYYCAVSLETASSKTNGTLVDENGKPMGIEGVVKNKKNKVSTPYQECDFRLIFNKGLDRNVGLCDLLMKDGAVVSPTKGWYSIKGDSAKHRKEALETILVEKISKGELALL